MNATNNSSAINLPQDEPLETVDPLLSKKIVSVNAKGAESGNKVAKSLFIIACLAILIGALAFFGQNFINSKKAAAKEGKSKADQADLLNPERTVSTKAQVGAASGKPPPAEPTVPIASPGFQPQKGIRPIRGADGKVMLNAQGKPMGVDENGNVVDVPGIDVQVNEAPKKALPTNAANNGATQQNQQQSQPPPKPPSRYGGSLFVTSQAGLGQSGQSGSQSTGQQGGAGNTQQNTQQSPQNNSKPGTPSGDIQAQGLDMLKSLLNQNGSPAAQLPTRAPVATPYIGQPPDPSQSGSGNVGGGSGSGGNGATSGAAGSVGASLTSSSTPVARAKLFPDQNLMLPKGRQLQCILTGKIDDQLPGFTSCALAANIYSDNGKVLLLERGSELIGEYGNSQQQGNNRLFVNWMRVKTPLGVDIDLVSPGTDALGGSGLPGHLNPRWAERVGAALLISVLKDLTVAIVQSQSRSSSTSVTVTPGQNTIQGGSGIADQVIRETLRVRPNITINEGERISIFVARDLDFRPVYALRSAGNTGKVSMQ